jgi:hypothetical protein
MRGRTSGQNQTEESTGFPGFLELAVNTASSKRQSLSTRTVPVGSLEIKNSPVRIYVFLLTARGSAGQEFLKRTCAVRIRGENYG